MANSLRSIGYEDADIPTVVIMRGTKLGWHKPVFKKNTYVVTLQGDTGRTSFKKEYRKALAEIWLDKIKAKDRTTFNEILATAPTKGKNRKNEVRTQVAEIIKKGTKKIIQKHISEIENLKTKKLDHPETRLAYIMSEHRFP